MQNMKLGSLRSFIIFLENRTCCKVFIYESIIGTGLIWVNSRRFGRYLDKVIDKYDWRYEWYVVKFSKRCRILFTSKINRLQHATTLRIHVSLHYIPTRKSFGIIWKIFSPKEMLLSLVIIMLLSLHWSVLTWLVKSQRIDAFVDYSSNSYYL